MHVICALWAVWRMQRHVSSAADPPPSPFLPPVMPLDINLFREEKGGNLELVWKQNNTRREGYLCCMHVSRMIHVSLVSHDFFRADVLSCC